MVNDPGGNGGNVNEARRGNQKETRGMADMPKMLADENDCAASQRQV
jgi:hypothetical protein